MKTEREELAELFARFLLERLTDEGNVETWERLRKSTDKTIANGCEILAAQVDDTCLDVGSLVKSEWD